MVERCFLFRFFSFFFFGFFFIDIEMEIEGAKCGGRGWVLNGRKRMVGVVSGTLAVCNSNKLQVIRFLERLLVCFC